MIVQAKNLKDKEEELTKSKGILIVQSEDAIAVMARRGRCSST